MPFDVVKDKIEDIVKKIKSDPALLKNFKDDPIKTVESLIGIDLPDDIVKKIVDGVKDKIGSGKKEAKKDAKKDDKKDGLGGILNMFKK